MKDPLDLKINLDRLEGNAAQKRRAWYQNRRETATPGAVPSPRDAYELLCHEYLKLSREDVAIISESKTEIVWESRNRCVTLDACQRAGLETALVCRAVYEKSTQALISQLDPQLRFLRSYEEIRPKVSYCKEWIVRIDFECLMRLAIEQGKISKTTGNTGHGVVICLGNHIVALEHDTSTVDRDPNQHATVKAIRAARRVTGDHNLCGMVLISTCDPCSTCMALAVDANISTVVYGAMTDDLEGADKARRLARAKETMNRLPVLLEVIGGVLRDECRTLYA